MKTKTKSEIDPDKIYKVTLHEKESNKHVGTRFNVPGYIAFILQDIFEELNLNFEETRSEGTDNS